MHRVAAVTLLVCLSACGKPAVQGEQPEHAPSRSLAHPSPPPRGAPQGGHEGDAARGARELDIDGVEALVERAIARKQLPGCVIAIGDREGVRYLRAFGERTQGEPMTLDTHFDLASLTKPIATAMSVMALAEQGAIELDAQVHRYLPELNTPDKRAITVRHLLLHTSGLPRVNGLSAYEQGKAEALRAIVQLPLHHAPGSHFEYSDLGFILLGELVERVSGVGLAEYAQKRVFAPLGMRDTRFTPPPEDAQRCAPTEERDEAPIRGVVDDPRAYRLGGVAGHAGLFSTVGDLARFAQMLLRRGELDGTRVLAEETVARMLTPSRAGTAMRALGFDAQSPYAHARGQLFSERAVGHGGYTGTSLWLDPERDLFVVLLSNRVHVGPSGTIHPLASSVADLSVRAVTREPGRLYTGIDVLVQSAFAELRGRSIAVLTHAAARDREGVATLERLKAAQGVQLKAVFTPEHGFDAKQEGHIDHQRWGSLPVYSLFGKKRKPEPKMLRGVDTVVIDLVDVGTRFYTYMSTSLAVMEAAAELDLDVVLLDRPNPVGGAAVEGPLSEEAFQSFVNFHPLPLRHGMTAGELARFLTHQRGLPVRLRVVRVENWERSAWFGDTDLVWYPPSPNLGTKEQAMLYPAVALVEGTNLSVGRGTEHAFKVLGAPFLDGPALAGALAEAKVPGVKVAPTRFTPLVGPYKGQELPGVAFELTDPQRFSAAQLGFSIIKSLRKLHAAEWDTTRLSKLVAHRATLAALERDARVEELEASWRDELRAFEQARSQALLY